MESEIYNLEEYRNDCCKIIEKAIANGKYMCAEVLDTYWKLGAPTFQRTVIIQKGTDDGEKLTRGYSILHINKEYYKIYFYQGNSGISYYRNQLPEKIETIFPEDETIYFFKNGSYILTLV